MGMSRFGEPYLGYRVLQSMTNIQNYVGIVVERPFVTNDIKQHLHKQHGFECFAGSKNTMCPRRRPTVIHNTWLDVGMSRFESALLGTSCFSKHDKHSKTCGNYNEHVVCSKKHCCFKYFHYISHIILIISQI